MAIKKTRILIVDDSMLFRSVLEKGLLKVSNFEVVGHAGDPFEAKEKIIQLNPDVVTMDVEMPKMNGIEFLKRIIPIHPLPVVVVSSVSMNVFDALDAGAVDFVRKPSVNSPADMDMFLKELCNKIRIASNATVSKIRTRTPGASNSPIKQNMSGKGVIAIGASTGGTEAILEVVKNFPANTPGVVIVQHMPPVFTRMYAERLNKICNMIVKEATDGDIVKKGQILIAAGDKHMRLVPNRGSVETPYKVKCDAGEKVSGHCPSVDVLFDSVADTAGNYAIGVILTGMGADGAKGMLKMKKAGAYTIGQNQETCVVYGMPMVAFNLGGVTRQMPLGSIASEVIDNANKRF